MPGLALTFYSVLRMPIADILECAGAAEEAGFEYISVAESFYRDGAALAAAIASRTRRIKLGTSVLPVYTRTAFQLAMATATLQELSGGRMGYLGLGVGYRYRTESYFGLQIERPVARMRETTDVVRRLLSGSDASYQGDFYSFKGFPKLAPQLINVPIYFGSSGSKMIELAGRIADGVILNSIPTPQHINHARGLLARGAASAKRDASRLTVASSLIYAVSNDVEEAAAAAKEDVLFYLGYPEVNPILEQSGLMEQAEEIRRVHRENGKRAALDLISQPMLDSLAIYGRPEDCRARLREMIGAGIDLPIIRVSNVPYPEAAKKAVFLRAIDSLRDFR
jgi:alkanesulfonate monooxygenase SsuD/methylene tetrahydromethanopterin reductase-like flavin-dependent oxidoreductase (luciferase family)